MQGADQAGRVDHDRRELGPTDHHSRSGSLELLAELEVLELVTTGLEAAWA